MNYLNPHTHQLDAPARPPVVALCGSTRFEAEFRQVAAKLTLAGAIVVKPDVFMNDGHAEKAHLPAVTPEVKQRLDALHLRKIDLADEVHVVNPGGYIGDSTRREIAYAEQAGKRVSYLQVGGTCDCESYDCTGECCGVGNCTCTPTGSAQP